MRGRYLAHIAPWFQRTIGSSVEGGRKTRRHPGKPRLPSTARRRSATGAVKDVCSSSLTHHTGRTKAATIEGLHTLSAQHLQPASSNRTQHRLRSRARVWVCMRSKGGGTVLLLAACALAACAAVAHGAAALQLGVINSASGALTDWNDTVKGERKAHAWAQRVHLSRFPRQTWPLIQP